MRFCQWFRKLHIGILLLVCGLAAGCAVTSKPDFMEYDVEGQPVMAMRYRRHLERDFEVRWSRKAYKKNNTSGPHFLLSDDQKEIKKEYGPPSYISRTFLSRHGDYVKEWLYWEEGVMFQFVRRKLVYQGLLTDKERILVIYGYPDDAQVFQMGDGIERENFYYYSTFGMTQHCYHLVNGDCLENFYLQ